MSIRALISAAAKTPFPIENLPYGVTSTSKQVPFPATRVGDKVINLRRMEQLGYFESIFGEQQIFAGRDLSVFMGQPYEQRIRVREWLSELLSTSKLDAQMEQLVWDIEEVDYHLPWTITDFINFSTSSAGANIKDTWHTPEVQYSCGSSVVISGTPIRRPKGQYREGDTIVYAPTKKIDFELAIGYLAGGENTPNGEPIEITKAEKSNFGVVLLNNWCAQDVKEWEEMPFTSKNFGTTISPWIVTPQALETFRTSLPKQNPTPIDQLEDPEHGSWNVKLQLGVQPEGAQNAAKRTTSNLLNCQWTIRQQITYQSYSGCTLRAGTLLATGSVSGADPCSYGSGIERFQAQQPVVLDGQVERYFLEDGDEVYVAGIWEGDGYSIGFGECAGKVLPSL